MMFASETFFDLLTDLPHWQFELFLMFLVDGMILGVGWPLFKRWVHRHDETHHPKDNVSSRHVSELSAAVQRIERLEACEQGHERIVRRLQALEARCGDERLY